MIPEDIILGWGNQAPWRDKVQIEQDLILHALICLIYSEKDLREALAFRGGTCLNKLYWEAPYRYSEDLDFVQIRQEPIGKTLDLLKSVIRSVFGEDPQWERKSRSFRLFCSYPPQGNPQNPQHVKIEINTREHFAIEGYRERPFVLDSSWKSGKTTVTTFSIEELLATKMRALYQRRKGRDLLDLWMSREMRPDYQRIAELYLEYAKKDGKKVNRDMLMTNLDMKLSDPTFLQDTAPLIRTGIDYDTKAAAEFVRDQLFCHIPQSKTKRRKKAE